MTIKAVALARRRVPCSTPTDPLSLDRAPIAVSTGVFNRTGRLVELPNRLGTAIVALLFQDNRAE